MGCFPYLCVGALDVPASSSLSSPPDTGCPVIYLSFTSSCYTDPTTGCDHGPSNYVLSPSMSFVWWVASGLDGCCGFFDIDMFRPPILSYESISILIVIGAYLSSYTSVALNVSSCGEGIASTSPIPSSYV
jgi:hypothetical protein